jgi:hypothetical protein
MTGAATSTNDAATNKELNNNNDPIHSFLTAHRLQSFRLATAWQWMHLLEFHYDTRKKSFYVDGHEREDVVANCTAFCKAYLTEYEPYCCRWLQISKEDAINIKNIDMGFEYHFHDSIAGADCVDFHVNYWNHLTAEEQTTAAGGPASASPNQRTNNEHQSIVKGETRHDHRARQKCLCSIPSRIKDVDRTERSTTAPSQI